MSHRFDRSHKDPYLESARLVERHVFSSRSEFGRGAEDQIYGELSNAIVTALGDIAAVAYRHGITGSHHIKGLAKAVSGAGDLIFECYTGEVDPEPAIQAIETDGRRATLDETSQEKLSREIERTRQLEHLVLTARRLPDLLDYAGSVGLHVPDVLLDTGTELVGEHATPPAPPPDGAR